MAPRGSQVKEGAPNPQSPLLPDMAVRGQAWVGLCVEQGYSECLMQRLCLGLPSVHSGGDTAIIITEGDI